MPVSVENMGCNPLSGYSGNSFLPTYNNGAFAGDSIGFAPIYLLTGTTSPNMVTIFDVDGDGKPDLVVPGYSATLSSGAIFIYRNMSTSGAIDASSFPSYVAIPIVGYSNIQQVAMGDLDGDGKPDMAIADYLSGYMSVLRNTSTPGSISFSRRGDFYVNSPLRVSIADINGDGKPDVIVCNGNVNIFQNIATEGYLDSSSLATNVILSMHTSAYDVKEADMDGDGHTDLVTCNYNNTITVFHNMGYSSISVSSFDTGISFHTAYTPHNIAIGDLDGDGKPDVAVSNNGSNRLCVYRNTTTGGVISFADTVGFPTGYSPETVAIGDFDGDGKPDLAVQDNEYTMSVYRNTSSIGSITNTSFATRSDFPIAGTPSTYFLAVGDLDGDGRPDFVASNTDNNTVSIYRNVPKPPVGTISGPSLICIGSPMTLSNDSTGGTWSSSNTGIATIGSSTGFVTGVAPGIDTISYRTISGGVSKLTITVNVAPGAITGNLSICAGNNTLLSDSPAGGNWFSSNTAIATVSVLSPGVITGVSAGTTAISYMNSCGFVSTVLTVNALPSAAPVNNGPMCNGGSVILFAMPSGGANTYSWSGPGGIISTSQNPIVSPTTTVTYSLTVTNGTSGCTSSGYTTLVSVNPTPYAAPTNSGLVCGGGSVTLSANPGAGANTYAWSGPGGFSSTNQNPVIAPTVSGTYSLTVSSAAGLSGCSPSTIYSTFVAVNPSPTGTFTVTPDPLCTFSTATLTATYPTCAGNAIIIAGVPSTSFGSHTGVITTATDNVTLEAWVKWNGTGGIQTIISNGENSGGSAAGYSITVQDGVIQCYVDGVAVMNVTGSLPSGQWSHVALSRTSGIWKFYLNGANAALTNNTATPIMPAGNFYVGSIGSSLGTFDGAIDEVKVWNVGRTGSQINADMNACSTGAQTGLAGYWGFNEGAGTNAADGSGNGNDLTLTDVAWTTSGAIPNVYSIRSGDGATFTGVASQAYAYNTSGIYTASVTVTNGSGCSTMATAPLTVLDPPVFISGNMGLCLGDSTSLIEYATGGTWSSSNNAIATVNSTGVVTSVATGYDTVIYANGCGSPATATISVGLPVTGVYSVNPNPLCPGTTATLTATFSSCSGDAMAFTGSLSDAFHAGVVTTVQDNLTIEAWVKWNGTTGVQTIVENGSTGSDGYQLAINNGNVVCYLGGYLTLTSSVNLTAYQWEHVALVRNSGIWTLYHNGLSNSVTNNTATPFMPSGNFTIGSNSTSYQGFVGEIDEVKIWNVARGGTEVNFDMNACSSGPQTGLVGYWSFNEGSGTTAADGSGNGNTLTTDNISWSASGGVQNTYEFWPGEGSFISGNSTENHTYNTPGTFISYVTVTSAAGCSTIVYDTVTVTGPATNIAGNANVCVGATTLLADGLAGGSWHSGNTSVATIDTTGTVTGITAGTTLITYLVNNSCGVSTAYVTVTVNPITSAGTISGILTLCVGGHTSLSDTSGSGYWGSENGSVASVNSDGNVFGYTVGTATITLTRVGYCGGGIATAVVTVSAASAGSITGPSSVNVGSSITLTDVVAGGVWSASNADVTVFGGLVTGAAAGSVTISYTTTGSCAATSTKSNCK